MDTMASVLYSCFVFLSLVSGKVLEHPPCIKTLVKMDNTCEVCVRPQQNGECYYGYKCSSDVVESRTMRSCSYTRLKGWVTFTNERDITAFRRAKFQSSPIPLISSISLYQRNQTQPNIGYPALNVIVNVPYLLYGEGIQNEAPEYLRMVFSSVEEVEHRDQYYYDNKITRFYRFEKYAPTSNDKQNPKQVQFKCLTGLDICDEVRVYNIRLTTYSRMLYIEQNFTATAHMNEIGFYPIIATALLPNNSVYVVFNPKNHSGVLHEIYLEDSNGNRKTEVKNFPKSVQVYACWFHNVEPGTYSAQLLIKSSSSEPVKRYPSATFTIPRETGTGTQTQPMSISPKTEIVIPIIVIGSCVIASVLLLLLYWQRKNNIVKVCCENIIKLCCKQPTNQQEHRKKSFLLYPREAENFVNCITEFLKKKIDVVSDKNWERHQRPPTEMFKIEIRRCSHLLVLWSPGAANLMSNDCSSIEINSESTVQDYFKEAINFAKDVSTTGNLKVVVLCMAGYTESETVPNNIGQHRVFDLPRQCKRLLNYITGDESNLNDIDEDALREQVMQIINPVEELGNGDDDEITKNPLVPRMPHNSTIATYPHPHPPDITYQPTTSELLYDLGRVQPDHLNHQLQPACPLNIEEQTYIFNWDGCGHDRQQYIVPGHVIQPSNDFPAESLTPLMSEHGHCINCCPDHSTQVESNDGNSLIGRFPGEPSNDSDLGYETIEDKMLKLCSDLSN